MTRAPACSCQPLRNTFRFPLKFQPFFLPFLQGFYKRIYQFRECPWRKWEEARLPLSSDYKWIKIVGVLAKQFKIDHPNITMPYDIDKMQEKCEALRKEYDEIRKELAPYYPEFQEDGR